MWYGAFLALVDISAGALIGALGASLDNPYRDGLFAAAYSTAAVAVLCMLPPLQKWLRSRRKGIGQQFRIECDPTFDERLPSRTGGTVHLCKVRISNRSDRIVTNGRIKLVDLTPPHQGERAFLLRDSVMLATGESVMVSIASHVEGSGDNAEHMSLQLPIFGAFYMSAGRGIITGEHHLTVRFERENEGFGEKRFRLYVNRINVMHLSKMI